jgi:hypothetical protein
MYYLKKIIYFEIDTIVNIILHLSFLCIIIFPRKAILKKLSNRNTQQ